MKYPYSRHILVCTGARCNDASRGRERSEVLRDELKDHNKKLGRKPTVRVCSVSCLDLCDYGPNIVVWPEGTVFSHLDRDKGRRVYDAVMGDGGTADDLELSADELWNKK